MQDKTQPNIPQNIPNVKGLVEKAKEIYNSHKEELESSHTGEYVAIDVNSGRYFVAPTKDETMAKARKEFPKILLFIRRIGELEKVSHHSSSFSPKKYASFLWWER